MIVNSRRRRAAILTALVLMLPQTFLSFSLVAHAEPEPSALTFDSDYARDRFAVVNQTQPTLAPVDHPIKLGYHLSGVPGPEVMGSTGTPSAWKDPGSGDTILYQFGWHETNDGQYSGLIYAIDATKVQQMVSAGQTNYYPAAYLWQGDPIQLPTLPKSEAQSGGAGVSISPNGWAAVGWGGKIYIWPLSAGANWDGHGDHNTNVTGMQVVSIKGVGSNSPNVSSAPAFFRDGGYWWVTVGSWSGGLSAGVLTDSNQWVKGTTYATTDTDIHSQWGAISSSPSWDPQATFPKQPNGHGTLYFGVNNTDSQWHPSGTDYVMGWVVGFDPLSGQNYSIGYKDSVSEYAPGFGIMTSTPIDSSVVVSPSGQSLFIPARNGSVYWYPATPNSLPNDIIWSSDKDYRPDNPATWDISNLAFVSTGGGNGTLFRVPEDKGSVDEALVRWTGGPMGLPALLDKASFSEAGVSNWIDPSAVKVTKLDGSTSLEILANTFGGDGQVLYANLDSRGFIKPGPNEKWPSYSLTQIPHDPPGNFIPDFASAVPLPRGGMAVWTADGLMLWVSGKTPLSYSIGVSVTPNPTYPSYQEQATIVVPEPDWADSLSLSWPTSSSTSTTIAVATKGQLARPPGYETATDVTDPSGTEWRVYTVMGLEAPPSWGTYPVVATAMLPDGMGSPQASTDLEVDSWPNLPIYVQVQGTLSMNPDPSLWGQKVTATLSVSHVDVSVPAHASIVDEKITGATFYWPRKDPRWTYLLPYPPLRLGNQMPMTITGGGPLSPTAQAEVLVDWWDGGGVVPPGTFPGNRHYLENMFVAEPAAGLHSYIPARTDDVAAVVSVDVHVFGVWYTYLWDGSPAPGHWLKVKHVIDQWVPVQGTVQGHVTVDGTSVFPQ